MVKRRPEETVMVELTWATIKKVFVGPVTLTAVLTGSEICGFPV